jgi:hypothetical protein
MQSPSASYLSLGEEWDVPAADLIAGRATSPPAAVPQKEPFGQRAGPVPRGGSERGRVSGIARSVQLRGSEQEQWLSFRVDQHGAEGNRVQAVGVEVRGYRGGQLSEGEEVEVTGRWEGGTLRADRVLNWTTGALVKGRSLWGDRLQVTVAVIAVIFMCGVIAFVGYGFITYVLS